MRVNQSSTACTSRCPACHTPCKGGFRRGSGHGLGNGQAGRRPAYEDEPGKHEVCEVHPVPRRVVEPAQTPHPSFATRLWGTSTQLITPPFAHHGKPPPPAFTATIKAMHSPRNASSDVSRTAGAGSKGSVSLMASSDPCDLYAQCRDYGFTAGHCWPWHTGAAWINVGREARGTRRPGATELQRRRHAPRASVT